MAEPRGEAGATSIVVLALAFALVFVAWGSGSVVGIVVAHRAAQSAADLAALAAAQEVARAMDGCAAAGEVATANHARLVSCDVEGGIVAVEVAVTASGALTGRGADVRARARAGPSRN